MKITLSKSQWENMGKKARWIKTAQGSMNRNEEEMYSTTGKPQPPKHPQHPQGKELTLDMIDILMTAVDISSSNRNTKADFLDLLIESAKRKRKTL